MYLVVVNNCINVIKCTEDDHQKSRRTNFKAIKIEVLILKKKGSRSKKRESFKIRLPFLIYKFKCFLLVRIKVCNSQTNKK